MDFSLTEDQRAIRDAARDFALGEVEPAEALGQELANLCVAQASLPVDDRIDHSFAFQIVMAVNPPST